MESSREQLETWYATRLWVKWQSLRRCPEYQKAVQCFESEVAAGPSGSGPFAFLASGTMSEAYHTVWDTYNRITKRLSAELTEAECDALETMHGEAFWAVMEEVIQDVHTCLKDNSAEFCLPLTEFQRESGILFPLAPSIPYCLPVLIVSPQETPIFPAELANTDTITLGINLTASKAYIMQAVERKVSQGIRETRKHKKTEAKQL